MSVSLCFCSLTESFSLSVSFPWPAVIGPVSCSKHAPQNASLVYARHQIRTQCHVPAHVIYFAQCSLACLVSVSHIHTMECCVHKNICLENNMFSIPPIIRLTTFDIQSTARKSHCHGFSCRSPALVLNFSPLDIHSTARESHCVNTISNHRGRRYTQNRHPHVRPNPDLP